MEILKEFRNILFGQEIVIYTDHKNLTYKGFNTERVLRWRLLIEEYNPLILHKPSKDNVVADSLSRLPREGDFLPVETNFHFQENFGNDELDDDIFPVSYSLIDKEQQKDKKLLAKLKLGHYGITSFLGGDKTVNLVTWKEKIVIPSSLENRVAKWYHTYLLHPGINRTESTIQQHLYWPNMRAKIREHCDKCPTCQLNKKSTKKYGLLPEKEAESDPWERICVDLIGPYTIKQKDGENELKLQAITMIDPATGWFKTHEYDDKRAITIANIV